MIKIRSACGTKLSYFSCNEEKESLCCTWSKSADHDFSKILIPTVVLLHDVLESIDQSFYRETPYIYMKVHATGPSSAIRNAKETVNA